MCLPSVLVDMVHRFPALPHAVSNEAISATLNTFVQQHFPWFASKNPSLSSRSMSATKTMASTQVGNPSYSSLLLGALFTIPMTTTHFPK
eukprot:2816496-Amphidinium_carterae.1